MNLRKVMYIAISAVCIISIISAIFIQFDLKFSSEKNQKISKETQT